MSLTFREHAAIAVLASDMNDDGLAFVRACSTAEHFAEHFCAIFEHDRPPEHGAVCKRCGAKEGA